MNKMLSGCSYQVNYLTVFVLIFLLPIDYLVTETEASGAKYWGRNEAKFRPEYVMQEFTARNKYSCLGQCDRTIGCISASWEPGEKLCLLSTEDQTLDHWKDSWPSQLIAISGWITYSRIVFPVFLIVSSRGRYSMTFSEAVSACEARGGYLAARDDLLNARSMGFDSCNCGWLSDYTIGFVLQQYNSECLDSFNDGIIACDWLHTSNAWCRFR